MADQIESHEVMVFLTEALLGRIREAFRASSYDFRSDIPELRVERNDHLIYTQDFDCADSKRHRERVDMRKMASEDKHQHLASLKANSFMRFGIVKKLCLGEKYRQKNVSNYALASPNLSHQRLSLIVATAGH